MDLARLLVAQHLAGAANLEVVHRQVEARAQFLHLLDRLEPPLCLLGQAFRIVHQQIGIGLVMGAADAAAQLVQLRQAELVGAVDQDRVGGRHVDAGLDDRRAQQDIGAPRDEIAHHTLELALVHLSVRDRDAGLRHQLGQPRALVLDGLDLVVQEVDLAATLELAQDRLAQHAVFLAPHERLDRQPLLRRGRDHREVAQSLERHAERARDRRRGQRQHVDLGAQRLQRLLLAHAEAMLLVDDDQAQPLEAHVIGQQLVRADHDVDGAVVDLLDRGLDLLLRLEARQLDDAHRPVGEAVRQRLEMLLGQQRGRRQHRDLLAAHHRDEGRAQRHLGLAEADVAADQPVHRLARGHVGDHRRDRRGLVRRLFEAEALGEGLVVLRRQRERMAFAQRPARVQVQQLGGGIADLLRGAALGAFPLARTERMQRRGLRVGARIARDHMQLVDRHIQLAALVVVQMQEFLVALAHVERDQALVAADAVLAVHDRIADLQLGQVAHHRVDAAGLLLLAAAGAARGIRIELGLGDEGEIGMAVGTGQHEAALQRCHRDRERRVAGEEGRAVLDRVRTQAAVGEQLQQRLAAARRVGAHQHACLLAQQQRLQVDQRVLGAAIDRDVGQRGRQRRRIGAGRALLQHQPRQRLGGAEELLFVQEQLRGRQQRPFAVVPHEVVALLRIGPEAADRVVDRADIGQLRAGRQVVEQRRGRLEEQRQVVLDAGRRHAVADVLVDRRLARVALEHLAPAAAERGTRGLVERKLAAGQQAHFLDRVQAALRVRVERANGFDLVAEQVDPVGQRGAHREQVDQAAAHAVFAGPHHRADVLVAGQRELRLQRGLVEPFALLEEEGVGGQEGGRR